MKSFARKLLFQLSWKIHTYLSSAVEKKIAMVIAIKSIVLVFVTKSKMRKQAKTVCLSIEVEETQTGNVLFWREAKNRILKPVIIRPILLQLSLTRLTFKTSQWNNSALVPCACSICIEWGHLNSSDNWFHITNRVDGILLNLDVDGILLYLELCGVHHY